MPFGEYELSPSLIGLSLLHTPHPEAFQRLLVRSSIPCYRDFNLDMCRSLGFASAPTDYKRPVKARFHCGYTTISGLASPVTATRRFIMQKARRHCYIAAPTACRRMVSGTISLFFIEVLFTFPSRYWYAIGLVRVFSLAGWSRPIHAEFLVLRATQDDAMSDYASGTGPSPSVARLSSRFSSHAQYNIAVLQPQECVTTLVV
jgi:hypothetical protein